MSLLTCKDIAFSYEGVEVLSGINFSLNKGDYLCVVGENGAGKSTLIKGLLNLKKPSKGKIITGEGFKQNTIGYVSQQTLVQKDFPASVFEVVLTGRLNGLGLFPFYKKEDKQVAEENMKKLGIIDLKNCCYRELSGGQRQRVLLARARCATKDILLLDEPNAGRDPVRTTELYDIVDELNRKDKITIIMVSHDVKEGLAKASHVLHLGKKQLFFGTKEEYMESEYSKNFVGGGQNV